MYFQSFVKTLIIWKILNCPPAHAITYTNRLVYLFHLFARSIHQGRGLKFPCNDRTDEVNKLFIIWLFSFILNKNTIKTPEVIFHILLRALWLSSSLTLKKYLYANFPSVIEKIFELWPYFQLFSPTRS